MVKINGVNAEIVSEDENIKKITPSINEVLERMDNNFKDRQVGTQRGNFNFQNNYNGVFNSNSGNFFSNMFRQSNNGSVSALSASSNSFENMGREFDGNLLFSLLPLLLSGKKTTKMGFDNPIFKEIIKHTNSPLLQKIFELMPKLTKKQDVVEQKDSSKEQTKIDSYIKTNDFYSGENQF